MSSTIEVYITPSGKVTVPAETVGTASATFGIDGSEYLMMSDVWCRK